MDVASLWEKCQASVAETTRKRLQASEVEGEGVRGRAVQPERRARKKTPPKGQETQPDEAKVSDQAAQAPQEHPTPDRPDENNERGSSTAMEAHVSNPLSPSTESKLIDQLEDSLKPESAVDKSVDPPRLSFAGRTSREASGPNPERGCRFQLLLLQSFYGEGNEVQEREGGTDARGARQHDCHERRQRQEG